MTIRSPMLLSLAALLLTACAMVMGGPGPSATGPRAAPEGAPFRCALVARSGGGGTVVEGRLDAASAVSGTYALRVRASGASIDQNGDFAARPGQRVTVGEARLGGVPAAAVDGTLALTAGGRTTTCPLERR